MTGATRVAILVCALGASGCGSDSGASAPGGSGNAGGGGSAAGGAGGTGAIGSGGSAAAGPQVRTASFVPETTIGDGPALISFVNSTSIVMSLWVAQATFVAIPTGTTVGPDLTASDAVEDDTTAGKHQQGLCIQFRLKKYVGPAALEPGKRYSMNVTFDDINGFVGTLTETAGNNFVAVRAQIHDPAPGQFDPSILTLSLGGERHAARWSAYDENNTNWLYAGDDGFSAYIDFVDRAGTHFASNELVQLSGAPGYTVVVGTDPAPNAALVIKLYESPQ